MINIEESYALLAPFAEGQRADSLASDDGRYLVRAQALVDGAKMQSLGISVTHEGGVTRLIFDFVGRLVAMAMSDLEDSAEALAREELRRKGIGLIHRERLLADPLKGPRRTSVLRVGDDISVRVKRLDAEDEASWLQIRVQMATAGAEHVHVVLTGTGSIVCVVSGRTDQDAWTRVQGELSRQGYSVS